MKLKNHWREQNIELEKGVVTESGIFEIEIMERTRLLVITSKVKSMAVGINAQNAMKDKIAGAEEVEELDGCMCKGSRLWMAKFPRSIIKSVVETLLRAIVFRLSLQNLVLQGGGNILKCKFWPPKQKFPHESPSGVNCKINR